MATVRLKVDDKELQDALAAFEDLARDATPLWYDALKYLQRSTDQRFDRRISPDGKRWDAVSDDYAKRKQAGKATSQSGAIRDPSQILQLTRDMRSLIRHQLYPDEMLFGSDRAYAATQNWDDPRRNIKARQWLGLSADDDAEIERIIADHIQDVISPKLPRTPDFYFG